MAMDRQGQLISALIFIACTALSVTHLLLAVP